MATFGERFASRRPGWADRVRSAFGRWTGRARRAHLLSRMRPGDIVLASPRLRRLSIIALAYRVLLRSRYVHGMLYLGDGRMIHTTARHGVVEGPMPGKVFDHERYSVHRAPGLDPQAREAVVAYARRQLDRRLDHAALATNIPSRWFGLPRPLWRLDRERIWCSKLIVESYAQGAGVDLVPHQNHETVVSEDLARSPVLERVPAVGLR